MIAIPAIDLRDGACVQLVGGVFEAERVRIDDPMIALRRWESAGFTRLHVVDLDAAVGRASTPNRQRIAEVLESSTVPVQVGGGIRDDACVAALVDAGASAVVVGTRAITDPAWLERLVERCHDRIIVAADVRDREVVIHGWQDTSRLDIGELLPRLEPLPIAGLLVTAVHLEGQMRGPDVALTRSVVAASTHSVIASGGVGSLNDLRALRDAGTSGVVIGMALYTGALDARAVAEEFCE